MSDFDVAAARAHFPALSSSWALFDNAGGSVTARPVIDRVHRHMERLNVQLGATYALSEEATAAVAAGHAAAATLVNADPDEVVLGPSSTMNVYVLAQALRATFTEGDEVIVTDLDHESNIGAFRRLAETGVVVREWRMNRDTASLELEDLEPLLGPRTRLVCFTHCSNVVGTIHDVAAITARVHEAGARVFVDGVAFAPHRRVDVRALGVDYYFLSLYKTYGPHLGLLYGRRDHLVEARSQNHFFYEEEQVPQKLMPGNVSHELAAGIPGVLDYLASIDADIGRAFDEISAHEAALAERLLAYLRARPDVRVLGQDRAPEGRRVPTIAFTVAGRHASEIPPVCDAAQVAIRWGDFYAARAIDALGLREAGGVIRASMVHYNTLEEVDRLIVALDGALAA